ncbi:MAG: histidinol dehydrogenase [Synergistaceae bacterium]|jgi:histidinol dehydrogenase/sulfopropanediol 3-dehydrogenase|nr:histidinol dehydrogenase [Synergistaceae bacterium]
MSTEKSSIRWLKESEPALDSAKTDIERAVAEIARDVRLRGADAVREHSRRLDGFDGPFGTPYEAALSALDALDTGVKLAIEESIRNVRRFHSLEKETLLDREWELSLGVRAGFRYVPVDSAAVYIPGGRYPLVSSAVMCVVPAQEAGVRRIAAFSPPGRDGKIDATVLAALALLDIREIWAIGGAQAIAAAALGAGEIGKVDFIAGPGNAYVAEAKRSFFGTVGIDGVAGPSEVLILADERANFKYAARDLLAQSEHDPMARACLVTTSEAFARDTMNELASLLPRLSTTETAGKSWARNGAVGIAGSLDDAIDYANSIAPEHLQLALANPRGALENCRAYGAAFLGYSSSEVFGDYIAGTNHTLPTAGRSKFSSGLWTGSFMRIMTHLDLSPDGASRMSGPGETLARTEGLDAHADALRARGRTSL